MEPSVLENESSDSASTLALTRSVTSGMLSLGFLKCGVRSVTSTSQSRKDQVSPHLAQNLAHIEHLADYFEPEFARAAGYFSIVTGQQGI